MVRVVRHVDMELCEAVRTFFSLDSEILGSFFQFEDLPVRLKQGETRKHQYLAICRSEFSRTGQQIFMSYITGSHGMSSLTLRPSMFFNYGLRCL